MEFEVAIPAPLMQTFSYSATDPIAAGTRVRVPFGGRKMVGVVTGPVQTPPPKREFAIKPIFEVIDSEPILSEKMLKLGQWMSQYYLHPLGEVYRAMLPASSEKRKQTFLKRTAEAHEVADVIFGAETKIERNVVLNKIKKLKAEKLIEKSVTLKRLIDEGILESFISSRVKVRALDENKSSSVRAQTVHSDEELPVLTEDQKTVLSAILPEFQSDGQMRPHLIWGVTGSGKTEVYLRLIQELLNSKDQKDEQAQVLVLVPEISLTPQMTNVFEKRFPGIVAVVHSAMTDTDRWNQLLRIRNQEARILIGPRSAVFGPFLNLRLVIVDEEHDSSYKQQTGLSYHGRDVAVMRAMLEGAKVVLGSATPSMESLHNAHTGKYHLVRMPKRVATRPLPEVEIIQAPPAQSFGVAQFARKGRFDRDGASPEPVHPSIIEALAEVKRQGKQAMVLVNRRGFAFYLFSLTERKAVQCPHCSISLTLHAQSTILICHYCEFKQSVSAFLEGRDLSQYRAVGFGSQRIEEYLASRLPEVRMQRLDSDVITDRTLLPELLAQFRKGDIDVLVGTQILAKGHDFPNVTLVAIIEIDQQLNLPDFRAGERTFQLLVQAAGRAGRAEHPGKVLIQTQRPDHPILRMALAQDFEKFAAQELAFRKQHHYPPFSRIIALEITSAERSDLIAFCEQIEHWLKQVIQKNAELAGQVRIQGPTIPGIEVLRGRYRRSFLFISPQPPLLRALAERLLKVFPKLPGDVRIRVDVDPQSLL